MKHSLLLPAFLISTINLFAQNVGIGTNNATRAKLEVHGVGAGTSSTSVLLGGEGVGVSFQRGFPAIGYNQYRSQPTSSGKFIGNGYAAIQTFYSNLGYMAFEMMGAGMAEQSTVNIRRPLSFDYFGHAIVNRSGVMDFRSALTVGRGNYDATACFFGSTHNSFFNLGPAENTYIRAGKDGGRLHINDIPGGLTYLNGSVGINTATPEYPLEIRQANNMGIALINSSTFANWEFNIDANSGNLRLFAGGAFVGSFRSTNGAYTAVSDARLKTTVQDIPDMLQNYMKLDPVTYNLIKDSSKQMSTGFIAQDVRKLFPELVTINTDTIPGYPGIRDLNAISYEAIPVLTIKAIQEQQAIIQQQNLMIEKLQEKIDLMKKKVGH